MFIKLYGERNTNTNYFSKLIELNLHATELEGTVPEYVMKLQNVLPGNETVRDIYFLLTYGRNLGWKHSCVKLHNEINKAKIARADLCFLTITKNPYSWLLSLHRRPYHGYYSDKPDFKTFLKTPWKTIGRDNVRADLASPIELWNVKNRSYLQLSQHNSINTTTEKIFENPALIIDEISSKFSIQRKSSEFVNFEQSTKEKGKDSNYYRNYYLSELWKDHLSLDVINIINASVDRELMSHFGYPILSDI